ncbi:hypothetical protein MetMK1DRAFT_00000340 [Metallosphaera yellowstonensis MK1]|uniref:Uncharacterized protein n=1 Tax=Metallosphaera yellowstonensis MK1 TaxID=671065 RepID=H2C0G3_9CREN|nr:hypothetical protein MetMK1DRAFT_00000340 [Metallosphaera yellowstonensis MK1]
MSNIIHWSKHDENVIKRFELVFPFYMFEQWLELLEGNRYAIKPYRA